MSGAVYADKIVCTAAALKLGFGRCQKLWRQRSRKTARVDLDRGACYHACPRTICVLLSSRRSRGTSHAREMPKHEFQLPGSAAPGRDNWTLQLATRALIGALFEQRRTFFPRPPMARTKDMKCDIGSRYAILRYGELPNFLRSARRPCCDT
jgi:hypothetical protein